MNKISVTIFLVLCFATSVFTQSTSISKGSTVVPKFTFKWSDFDSSWGGFLKLNLKIEQNSSGNLTINGNEDWKAIPIFPAYDGSSEGLKDNLYRTEYPTSSIVAYKVSKIERKKELTEVNLSKLNDRVVDLKLQVGNSVKDVDKASLKLFIEADITDQELVDKSIILMNDSRVRVNLSQFSN